MATQLLRLDVLRQNILGELLEEVTKLNTSGTNTATACDNAVLLAVALQERKDALLKMVKLCTAAITETKMAAGAYAQTHANYLDEPLTVVKSLDNGHELVKGVRVIAGLRFVVTQGVDRIRAVAGNITQAVLERLPDDWVREKLELDTENINALGVTDNELGRKGLCRPVKYEWYQEKEVSMDVPEE